MDWQRRASGRIGFPPPGITRRLIGVTALLLLCAIAYVLVLAHFQVMDHPREPQFGAPAGTARVLVYVEPVAIDAVNDGMQVRVSVSLASATDRDAASLPDQELVLVLAYGSNREEVEIRGGRAAPPVNLVLDLTDGDVSDYPLDRFRSALQLDCFAKQSAQSGELTRLPIHVTAWEGVLGFIVRATRASTDVPGAVGLTFQIRRTGAFAVFALAAYGAMAVLAVAALAIGILVFTGTRRIEVTLVGALGAMVFALPALRNTLPGAPPLGVRADLFVFLWAELAAVISLALFVTAWARRGPGPSP